MKRTGFILLLLLNYIGICWIFEMVTWIINSYASFYRKWKIPRNSIVDYMLLLCVYSVIGYILLYSVVASFNNSYRLVRTWDKRIKTSSAHLGWWERIIKLRVGEGDPLTLHQTCHLFDGTKGLQSATTWCLIVTTQCAELINILALKGSLIDFPSFHFPLLSFEYSSVHLDIF